MNTDSKFRGKRGSPFTNITSKLRFINQSFPMVINQEGKSEKGIKIPLFFEVLPCNPNAPFCIPSIAKKLFQKIEPRKYKIITRSQSQSRTRSNYL